MKNLCLGLLFFVSIPLNVQAQEAEAGANGIEKVSYLPGQGKVSLNTAVGVRNTNLVTSTSAGIVAKSKTNATVFNYTMGYGVANSLVLGILGQISSSTSDATYGPGSTSNGTSETSKSSGWAEPEIGLVWRARENSNTNGIIDLVASARPRLQTAKSSSNGSDGNEGIGGTQFSVSARFYKEVRNLQFSLIAKQNLQTVATFEDADNARNTREISQHQSTELTFGLEGRASEEFLFGANLSYARRDSFDSISFTAAGKGGTVNYGALTLTSAEVYAKFKIDESSVLRLSIDTLLNASQTANSGTTKIDVKYDTGTAFTVGWLQEF